MKKFALALACTLSFSASAVAADVCPVDFQTSKDYMTDVAQIVVKKETCAEAAATAEACAMGSSMDSVIAGTASVVCKTPFEGRLKGQAFNAYLTLIQHCVSTYEDQQGSMYVSMQAFCELSVNKLFNELYAPAP